MAAQTYARRLQITINGNDYSDEAGSVVGGYSSYSAGQGLVTKTAELVLVEVVGGQSLDPRDNPDLDVGNIVTITRNDSYTGGVFTADPILGKLFIINSPTIEPIDTALPAISGNIRATIPLGCQLAYANANQPDEDASGVSIGVTTAGETVVQALLEEAGIDNADIGLSAFENSLAYPVTKQGGSWVNQAAQLTYALNSSSNPSVLYCDSENIVRVQEIDPDSTASDITITLGSDDRDYLPQLEPERPPQTSRIVSVSKSLKFRPNPLIREESEAGIGSDFGVEQGPGSGSITARRIRYSIRYLSPPTSVTVRVPDSGTSPFRLFILPGGTERIELDLQEPRFTVDGATGIGTNPTALTSVFKSEEYKQYDNGLLFRTIIKEEQPAGKINLASAQLGGFEGIEFKPITSFASLIEQEIEDNAVVRRKTIEWRPKIVVNPDDTTPFDIGTPDGPFERIISRTITETWTFEGRWINTRSEQRTRIQVDPDFVPEDGSEDDIYDLVNFVPQSDPLIDFSNTGSANPPRPEQLQALVIAQENHLEGSATIASRTGNQPNTRLELQIPYAIDEDQLDSFAEVEGKLAWGRQQQYLIEFGPDLITTTLDKPFIRIQVIEPSGTTRLFLSDALTTEHQATESFVGCAGIYLGTVSGGSFTSRNFTVLPALEAPLFLAGELGQTITEGALI